jgi:hypothetical protein
MTLLEYLESVRGESSTTQAATVLAGRAGVSLATVRTARDGEPVGGRSALAISLATGGAVSVASLCEGWRVQP